MPYKKPPHLQQDRQAFEVVFDGVDCFIVVDDVKIAKRGDMEWISLEPGWKVASSARHQTIDIRYKEPALQ
jgi:hypothetical protein